MIAACRATDDDKARSLKTRCSEKLRIIKVDVSSDDEVAFAVYHVEKILDGRPLWALVNNAGIATLHGIEWGSTGVEAFRSAFDVNTLGVVRMCRAFLPYLRRGTCSRLVIVGSVVSRAEPLTEPSYAMSKFATRAFANSMRRELKESGIYLSVIEPAFYSTAATEEKHLFKELEASWKGTPMVLKEQLGGDRIYNRYRAFTKAALRTKKADCSPVINAMVQAIAQAAEPKYYYRVCSGLESVMFWLVDIYPEEIMDMLQNTRVMIFVFNVLKYLTNGPLYL